MSKDFFISSVGASKHTIGQLVRAVMAIGNETDAKLFYDGYLQWMTDNFAQDSQHTPEQCVRANIGWCFGEGMPPDKVKMWRETCNASHPVFGSMEAPVTPEEALDQGVKMAKGIGK